MDLNSTQLCRVCLQNSDDFVNIFDSFQDVTIAAVLTKHFSFQVKSDDELTEWLCQICWIQIKTFHIFYNRIEFLRESYYSRLADLGSADVITKEAFEFDLNIIKCEDTKLTEVNIPLSIENIFDCDDDNDYEESNNSYTSNDEDQSSHENPKDDHVGDMQISKKSSDDDEDNCSDESNSQTSEDDEKSSKENPKDDHINVIGTKTPEANIEPKWNGLTRSEIDKRNAEIREFFSMKCEICSDVEFETFLIAKKHYREVHKIRGYIMCCGKKFYVRSSILYHIRRHVNPDYRSTKSQKNKSNAQIREFFSMKCDICNDFKFETFLKAKEHYHKVHNIRGYFVCCGEKFHNLSSVRDHIRRHANSKTKKQDAQIREFFTMKCDICSDVEFETFVRARQHYRKVHNIDGYIVCCDRKFDVRGEILNHILMHVNPKAHHCDQCGKYFTKKKTLRNHIKNHGRVSSHKCTQCSKSFTQAKALHYHVENKHSKTGETFPCEKCNKKYPSKIVLTTHIRTVHHTLNPVCEICARQFKLKSTLQNHIKLKHPTTPGPKVQCNICAVWLKHEQSLQAHMKRKHGRNSNGPVNCPICKKVVKDKLALRGHIDYVHGQRDHQCVLCDKAFNSAKLLKEHIACHTGEHLYNCLFCEKKFKSSANLSSHRRKVHLAEWTQYLEKN